METPLWHVLITRRYLHVRRNDRIESDSLDLVGSEIDPRPVLGLICETRGIEEKPGLGPVVPLRPLSGDSLLLALIKDNVSLSNDLIGCFVDRHLVGLQSISSNSCIDVAFVSKDARVFGTRNRLGACFDF